MLKFKKKARKLVSSDFDIDESKFYVSKFIASESITMIYAQANQGKTYLSLAVSKSILENFSDLKELIYFDLDNGRRQLKGRNVEHFLNKYDKWEYYIRATMEQTKYELIQDLEDDCHNNAFANRILIFDTTGSFLEDSASDRDVRKFMTVMMKIRDNGGTVILLHHTTKNGKVIDGSAEFIRSVDNLFHLEKRNETDDFLQLYLTKKKERDAIDSCGFKVDKNNLKLDEMDQELAMMNEYEEDFVNKVRDALRRNPQGLGQTEVLNSAGFKKTDKTARDTLDRFENKFWKKYQEKKGKPITYTLI